MALHIQQKRRNKRERKTRNGRDGLAPFSRRRNRPACGRKLRRYGRCMKSSKKLRLGVPVFGPSPQLRSPPTGDILPYGMVQVPRGCNFPIDKMSRGSKG
jgi:hypothetical protein